MIIYGWRTRPKQIEKGSFQCPHCHQYAEYGRFHYRVWATLYFIPILPLGNAGDEIVCGSCTAATPADQMPQPVAAPYIPLLGPNGLPYDAPPGAPHGDPYAQAPYVDPYAQAAYGDPNQLGYPPAGGPGMYGPARWSQPIPYAPLSAIYALIVGVVSIILPIFVFPGLLAIVLGHVAISRIRSSNGALSGLKRAIAGTVLGYTSVAVMVLLMLLVFVRMGEQTDRLRQLRAEADRVQTFEDDRQRIREQERERQQQRERQLQEFNRRMEEARREADRRLEEALRNPERSVPTMPGSFSASPFQPATVPATTPGATPNPSPNARDPFTNFVDDSERDDLASSAGTPADRPDTSLTESPFKPATLPPSASSQSSALPFSQALNADADVLFTLRPTRAVPSITGRSFALSHNGRWLAIAPSGKPITIQDLETGETLWECKFANPFQNLSALAFSFDDRELITYMSGEGGQIWELMDNAPPREKPLEFEHSLRVVSLASSPKHPFIATGGSGGTVAWEPLRGAVRKPRSIKPFNRQVETIWLPESGTDAMASDGQQIVWFSLRDGSLLGQQALPQKSTAPPVFDRAGTRVVGSYLGKLEIYSIQKDAAPAKLHTVRMPPSGTPLLTAFHAEENWLIVASSRLVDVWDLDSGERLGTHTCDIQSSIRHCIQTADARSLLIFNDFSSQPPVFLDIAPQP
jgi:WD40 repeat protein/uncharacterized membrane protein